MIAEAVRTNTPADPCTLFAEEIADLMLEAKNWLDGEPIANEQQAEAVSSLLNRLRRVAKDADEARKVEKKPHDDAAKAVQARWTPIISKAELATSTAKQALAPWLRQLEERQRREAEVARQEADRIARVAAEAHAKASGNFEAAEDAERLLKAAQGLQKEAARAEKQKAHAKGGERAVGLRTRVRCEIVDRRETLKHYAAHRPDELEAWLLEQAEKDCRSGTQNVPGVHYIEERVAV